FHVGSHQLFLQAHIPASEYLGAGSTTEGIQNLRRRVSALPKNTSIVLYCGCCPWRHCPNVNPAYDALQQMGFTNVKVLFLANNFGADWVDKGYPVAKGE
ncbi:MAG: rhodanese-like domain-containing protein, partial [Terriglobales bacterium]